MLEPLLVDRPTTMPYKCASCGSQTDGPFTDWLVDILPVGRLYSCARCIRSDAIRRGLVDGKKAEHLRVVQDIATDAEHAVKEATEKLERMTKERDGWKHRWEEDTAHIDDMRQRIMQLEKRIRRDSLADLQLVTHDDAA